MRALITGAGGFVGPHLAAHLRACGDELTALDLNNGPDLRDGDRWAKQFEEIRPDVVYHLAGWSDVGGSWNAPRQTFEINILGTTNVLEAARLAEVETVVVISSADVYGQVSTDLLPLEEDAPMQPRSPYGTSKQAAEILARHYWDAFSVGAIIARPFNHLGPGQSLRFAVPAFANQMAELERSGGGAVSHGDLSPRRDVTDVRDVVRAYRLLATADPATVHGETFNICSGRSVPMQTIFDQLAARATVQITGSIDPSRLRPVDLPDLRGSYDKLATATGWRPEFELDTTLDDVLTEARSRIDGTEPRGSQG